MFTEECLVNEARKTTKVSSERDELKRRVEELEANLALSEQTIESGNRFSNDLTDRISSLEAALKVAQAERDDREARLGAIEREHSCEGDGCSVCYSLSRLPDEPISRLTGRRDRLMEETIPQKILITCDGCLKPCGDEIRKRDAGLKVMQSVLDYTGTPAANGNREFDLCDLCAVKVFRAINEALESLRPKLTP